MYGRKHLSLCTCWSISFPSLQVQHACKFCSPVRYPSFFDLQHACNFHILKYCFPSSICMRCRWWLFFCVSGNSWLAPTRDMASMIRPTWHAITGPCLHWDLERQHILVLHFFYSGSMLSKPPHANHLPALKQTISPCKHIPLTIKNQTC